MGKEREPERLSRLDIELLRLLMRDSRLSVRKIADKLGISPSTALNHIRKLEKSGVIRGYTARIDWEKLGYELTSVIGVVISKGMLVEVEREIAKMKGVFSIYDITGEFDALIIAKFKSRQEMSRFVKKLLRMEYVERTLTMVVLDAVKECELSI